MKMNPNIFIPAAALAMLPITYMFFSFMAGTYSSFSDNWLTASGLLVIAAVLLGYWWTDNRDPMAPGARFRYAAIASVVNGLNGYLNFMAITRAWRNASLPADQQDFLYQFFNPGVLGDVAQNFSNGQASTGMGGMENAFIGAFAGFLVTYYSFRWWNENAQKAES